jgi:mono/diheme cytochrome c family protein
MLTTVLIVLLGVALFAYVALPLILPGSADPLPADRDPVTADLEEEKAALFRAIRELDAREDLSAERHEQLRARYEAKAARVLRALDERDMASVKPAPRARRARAVPWSALTLLVATVAIATTLSAYVLPRVGEGATVTSFFADDLDAARALRDARRAAERDPSAANLLALGAANWNANDAAGAQAAYERAVTEAGARSAEAFRRLGFLTLQTDLERAVAYLERARELDPTDLDTLYTIGEVRFAQGDLEAAADAWRSYLATPQGAGDEMVGARLALAEDLRPLARDVMAGPSQENLILLANALWDADERERAVEHYFRVLTQYDPNHPVALGRTGQLLFISGRNEDAIALMERAAISDEVSADTLLFLGNAYFSAEQYEDAVAVWERHVATVGEENAGRVPGLIDEARSRAAAQAGTTVDAEGRADAAADDAASDAPANDAPANDARAIDAAVNDEGADGAAAGQPGGAEDALLPGGGLGEEIFAQNCARCHGATGNGGAGPRLAGSRRARVEQNVSNAVRFGRGMMPGFASLLSAEEIDAVVRYVTQTLSGGDQAR